MGKLLQYIRQEGIPETIRKICRKCLRKKSVTVFLACTQFPEKISLPETLRFVLLTEEYMEDFEQVKFFDHIQPQAYIGDSSREIILIYRDNLCVGYAAGEYAQRRQIHGLGSFTLEPGEAWIGPTYIRRQYRGQGLNAHACRFLLRRMHSRGITRCYTAINRKNKNSLRSFRNTGFQEIGTVTVTNGTICVNGDTWVAERFQKSSR